MKMYAIDRANGDERARVSGNTFDSFFDLAQNGVRDDAVQEPHNDALSDELLLLDETRSQSLAQPPTVPEPKKGKLIFRPFWIPFKLFYAGHVRQIYTKVLRMFKQQNVGHVQRI